MLRKLEIFVKRIFPPSTVRLLKIAKFRLRVLSAKAKMFRSAPLKQKMGKIRFEASIVEHCNLNCKGCSNFSCIAEPYFVSVEDFTRDMKRMGDLFGHECERIYLIGGEPLMHPDIVALMRIARENFTEGTISVFTNGTLLPSMGAGFWEACRDNDISLIISAYPIKLDTAKIESSAGEYGVKISWTRAENEHERSTFRKQRVNLAGTGDPALNFAVCGRGNGCISLNQGRLYTCTFASHVMNFSKYFRQDIQITDADSVNIYDDLTADEILQRLSEPIPACRYCDFSSPESFEWGPTKREITEWV